MFAALVVSLVIGTLVSFYGVLVPYADPNVLEILDFLSQPSKRKKIEDFVREQDYPWRKNMSDKP